MNTKQTLIQGLKRAAASSFINDSPESVNTFEIAFEALRNYINAEEALHRLSENEKQELCKQVLNEK